MNTKQEAQRGTRSRPDNAVVRSVHPRATAARLATRDRHASARPRRSFAVVRAAEFGACPGGQGSGGRSRSTKEVTSASKRDGFSQRGVCPTPGVDEQLGGDAFCQERLHGVSDQPVGVTPDRQRPRGDALQLARVVVVREFVEHLPPHSRRLLQELVHQLLEECRPHLVRRGADHKGPRNRDRSDPPAPRPSRRTPPVRHRRAASSVTLQAPAHRHGRGGRERLDGPPDMNPSGQRSPPARCPRRRA